MSLTVKVFFEQADGSNEIRRFPVTTAHGVDIFSETKAKIRQLFPALANGNFTLFWQDPDGDRIVFSSNEEMKDAVAYLSDGILRVYVSKTKNCPETDDQGQKQHKPSENQQPNDREPNNPRQHPGPNFDQGFNPFNGGPVPPVLTCSGCNSLINGMHYNCSVCINYNLCQACAGKGLHSEHAMFMQSQLHFTFPPHGSQQFTFPPHESQQFTFPPHGGPQFTFHPHTNQHFTFPPHGGQHFTIPPQPSFSFSKFGTGMPPGAYTTSSTTCKNFSSCETDINAGKDACGQTGINSNRKDSRKEKPKFQNEFGTNISANPYGIRVSCNVSDGSGTQKQENYQQSWWGRGGSFPLWGDMYFGAQQDTTPGGPHKETDDAATKADSKNSTSKNGNAQAPEETDNKTRPESGNPQWNWTHAKIQIPTTYAIPLPYPTSFSMSMANPQPQTATTTTSSSKPVSAPQPTSNSESSQTPSAGPQTGNPMDLRVQESLDVMLAMGFLDLDGSLSALLFEHNGDIGSTVDALKDKANQKGSHDSR